MQAMKQTCMHVCKICVQQIQRFSQMEEIIQEMISIVQKYAD